MVTFTSLVTKYKLSGGTLFSCLRSGPDLKSVIEPPFEYAKNAQLKAIYIK
jgi:hypothetical protein